MFNIQPGQGLGFTGSKEIALGKGGAGLGVDELDHRFLIIKDDEEVLGIITNIVTSGIL